MVETRLEDRIDPRSTLMKGIHVGLGVLWMNAIACVLQKVRRAWWAIAIAVPGLWDLLSGTLPGVAQIVLPGVIRYRGRGSG